MELTIWTCKQPIGVLTDCSDHCRTGETPWVKLMIEQHHETAKSNGAIVSYTTHRQHPPAVNSVQIIPSVGVESAPADMLAWSLAKRVRSDFSSGTRSINSCIKEMK